MTLQEKDCHDHDQVKKSIKVDGECKGISAIHVKLKWELSQLFIAHGEWMIIWCNTQR